MLLSQLVLPNGQSPDVRLVTDETDAVLSILRLRQRGQSPSERDWSRLFASEGYRALARRETSLGRPFSDDRFKAFVLSDSLLARTSQLAATVDSWTHIDVGDAAHRALAYLPAGTPLRSILFFEIKPQGNSFVFDVDGRRAIFLYVNPTESGPQLENTMTHELHHVGITAACTDSTANSKDSAVARVTDWMSAFGEGFAMLAAAGGPDVHPHALDADSIRRRWDHDVGNFNADLGRVQTFFFDILDYRIPADSIPAHGMSFFGIQGPWYTVGWRMAVTVEKKYGRPRLIAEMCRPVAFLRTYNQAAAGSGMAVWSDSLLTRMQAH